MKRAILIAEFKYPKKDGRVMSRYLITVAAILRWQTLDIKHMYFNPGGKQRVMHDKSGFLKIMNCI